MPKKHKKLYLLVILIVIIGLSVYLWPKGEASVETQKVRVQDITESVLTSGKVESQTEAKLTFISGGKLVYLGVKEGDFVEKRQTLASLDSRTVQKNIEQELRDYLQQRYVFDDIVAENQQWTVEHARDNANKRLLQNNQFDLDKTVNSVELQALVKEQSYLVSPIDGIVVKADAVVSGVNVIAGSGFVVADPDKLIFKIEVDEADVGKLQTGLPVKITLESFPNDPINLSISKIDFVSHVSINGGNVFDVEAVMPENNGHKYRIGMTGDAEIVLFEKKGVITVPLGSIKDNKYVYVKKGDKYEKREIELGIQSDTDREVVSGLSEGEEFVLIPDDVDAFMQNVKKFYIF